MSNVQNKRFKGKDFISLADYNAQDMSALLDLAVSLKSLWKAGQETPLLKGKTLAMIFQKASTRTRVSFEVAMYQLGGLGLFLSANDLQIGRGEPIQDTARVLASYCDGILIRTYSHKEVCDLAHYAQVPVINGLTDDEHPTQAIADLLTILECKGHLKGLKMAYLGDGNNVATSLMQACALTDMELVLACPEGYVPKPEVLQACQAMAQSPEQIKVVHDPIEAVLEADVIYTDVWTSMGQEEESQKRLKAFEGYQLNEVLLSKGKKEAMILHCLPAHRDEEITDGVIEGPQSWIFQQAENRMHAHKAILAALMA